MKKKIDPITLEVIYHRLSSIADEMETALLKSSMSTIVKEARDATTSIFDYRGQTVAQAVGIPVHLGTLITSVPGILEEFPVSQMKEGDVFIANDPYAGGTHLADITMVVPVIYKNEVIALSCSMVHHQDIGAMTPGIPATATSTYQEGLVLPPVKFYDAGKPVKYVHDIIRKNVRVSDMVLGDLNAQVAAGNVGKLRILELLEEYGDETIKDAMKQLMDYAETLTRRELSKIPDGSYSFTDYMDNDGIDLDKRIKIQVTITIQGSDFIFDLSGTAQSVKGPYNVCRSGSLAVATYLIRAITNPFIPSNAGCFRPIALNLPEGSIVNPPPDSAVGARSATIVAIFDTAMGALLKAIPNSLPAGGSPSASIYLGGTHPLTNKGYVTLENPKGGMGGQPTRDGIDVICTPLVNTSTVPIEAQEMSYPVRYIKAGLCENSGGAGRYRGGLGVERVLEALGDGISVTYRGERYYTCPWGIFGGHPGSPGKGIILRKSGEIAEIPSKDDFVLNKGDRLHVYTAGGGGYGDPYERKPEQVLRDVLDKKITLNMAEEAYGVIIDETSMRIDYEKTETVRHVRKKERGPITWTYDRGAGLGKE